jgi:5-methylcytosine-specific restriction endonuclease McrA
MIKRLEELLTEMQRELRLRTELIPQTAWRKNLRNELPRKVWDKIRTDICAYQGQKCGICGAAGRLSCHEVWEYDDLNHIQKLKRFIALCDLCHHIKHLGCATILAEQGKLEMRKIEEHFMRVNSCDLETFKLHAIEVGVKNLERSKHKWRLELGKYKWQVKIKTV